MGNSMIGVAITTHNRPDLLEECLAAFQAYGVPDKLLVVDDGSRESSKVKAICDKYGAALVRHDRAEGIPASKNKCLEWLMDAGCTDLFLFDDDTRPACDDWWIPYVNSPEPHLCYCWTHFKNGQAVEKMNVLYSDDELTAYGWSMGCMVYVHRDVISRVGGFAFEFGIGMEEHADFSQRIHNAGFTTFVHQDVTNSGGLFWAGDEHCAVNRSLPAMDRMAQYRKNEAIRLSRKDFAGFEPYRRDYPVVLASYFADVKDEQRPGRKMAPNMDATRALVTSVVRNRHKVVILNNFTDGPDHLMVPTDPKMSPYQQRWISQLRWLKANPNVTQVFMVDATDVVMQKVPTGLEPGTLYVGSENCTVGANSWLWQHSPKLRDYLKTIQGEVLLNCGVVGGDRETMLKFCQRMVDVQQELQATPLHEMAIFNKVVREFPYEHGPQVTTPFKKEEPNSWSYFKHK